MRLRIHRAASAEIEKEAKYYEKQAPGLGLAFHAEIIATVNSLLENPEIYPLRPSGVRICHTKRFPFNIVFRTTESELEVLVVRHDSRHPSYGSERL